MVGQTYGVGDLTLVGVGRFVAAHDLIEGVVEAHLGDHCIKFSGVVHVFVLRHWSSSGGDRLKRHTYIRCPEFVGLIMIEWLISEGGRVVARSAGEDGAGVLSTAFLCWIRDQDLRDWGDAPRIAGLLAARSDLDCRKIAGLLGLQPDQEWPIPEMNTGRWVFAHPTRDQPVEIRRIISKVPS